MAASRFSSGSGTQDDPYIYDTWDDYVHDNNQINAVYMKLNPDAPNKIVDYNEYNGGNPIPSFILRNNLDGSGWEIRNMYIVVGSNGYGITLKDISPTGSMNATQLTIKNIKLTNIHFSRASTVTRAILIGSGSSGGLFENCTITALLNLGVDNGNAIGFSAPESGNPPIQLTFDKCRIRVRTTMQGLGTTDSASRVSVFYNTLLSYSDVVVECTNMIGALLMYSNSIFVPVNTMFRGYIKSCISLTSSALSCGNNCVYDLRIDDFMPAQINAMMNANHQLRGDGVMVLNTDTIPYEVTKPGGYNNGHICQPFKIVSGQWITGNSEQIHNKNYLIENGYPLMDKLELDKLNS